MWCFVCRGVYGAATSSRTALPCGLLYNFFLSMPSSCVADDDLTDGLQVYEGCYAAATMGFGMRFEPVVVLFYSTLGFMGVVVVVSFFIAFSSFVACVAFFGSVGGYGFLAFVPPILFRGGFDNFINNGHLHIKSLWVLMSGRWSCFGALSPSQALPVCFHAYLELFFVVSFLWDFLVVHFFGCLVVGVPMFASLLLALSPLFQYP